MSSHIRHGRRAGFSLIEALWATALLGLVLGSVLLVGNAGSRAQHTGMVAHDVDTRMRRTIDRIDLELQPAGLQDLIPDPIDPEGNIDLEFRSSAGVVGGRMVWGPTSRLVLEYEEGELDNGLDDDGDGIVDEGQLVLIRDAGGPEEVRRVLCRGINELLEGEVDNDVDDNGNGLVDERGFCVTREGNRLVLRLSVVREDRGQRILRTIESAVQPRNTDPEWLLP